MQHLHKACRCAKLSLPLCHPGWACHFRVQGGIGTALPEHGRIELLTISDIRRAASGRNIVRGVGSRHIRQSTLSLSGPITQFAVNLYTQRPRLFADSDIAPSIAHYARPDRLTVPASAAFGLVQAKNYPCLAAQNLTNC